MKPLLLDSHQAAQVSYGNIFIFQNNSQNYFYRKIKLWRSLWQVYSNLIKQTWEPQKYEWDLLPYNIKCKNKVGAFKKASKV